jgi:hypothetical protein
MDWQHFARAGAEIFSLAPAPGMYRMEIHIKCTGNKNSKYFKHKLEVKFSIL